MVNVTDEMVSAFLDASFEKTMHEEGCEPGEEIRAGIQAILPVIRNAVLEKAAKVVDNYAVAAKISKGKPSFEQCAEHIRAMKSGAA